MLGVIIWLAKNHAGSGAYRAIVSGLFVGNLISLVVFLVGQLSGVVNVLGWFAIAAYALLAAGFGYYALIPSKMVTGAG
jgi:hypothetical protein